MAVDAQNRLAQQIGHTQHGHGEIAGFHGDGIRGDQFVQRTIFEALVGQIAENAVGDRSSHNGRPVFPQ